MLELLQELEASHIKRTPISFLPYLSGERTPHNDPLATGLFFGITNATTCPEMTLAILDGDLRFVDVLKKVCPPPAIISTHKPDFSLQAYYKEQRQKYQNLYQQTRALNQ